MLSKSIDFLGLLENLDCLSLPSERTTKMLHNREKSAMIVVDRTKKREKDS